MTFRERALRLRYNYIPDHLIGEILTKRWTDSAIPFVALVVTIWFFGSHINGFFGASALIGSTRQLGEVSIVVTGLAIVILGGGIDLSVGSIFALANFAAVGTFFVWGQPVWVAFLASMLVGLVFGCLNGYLIGYMRLRAFLTTLVTLIIGRAAFDILVVNYNTKIQSSDAQSDLWDFIGDGTFHGLSIAVMAAILIVIVAHIVITRSRPGWHILAVGGSRRSAHNAGIRVRRSVFVTYVISGLCCGLAGFLIGCRLSGAGPGTGNGLEILTITACVLGGNSLGGGRGSILKAVMGTIVVVVTNNGLIRMGMGTGSNQMVLGIMLAAAVILDIRWLKNRHKVLDEVYVTPIHHRLDEAPSALPGSGSAYALNNEISKTEYIGLDELEGPEDVILDREDNLYCGTRHGEIIRFFAPDYKRSEVFAHTGGFPLGLAFDQAGNLISCVGAMGLYSISPEREVTRLSAETRRTWTSIVDDARLRDPNDCDIAPDGRIFFTDSTTRYDAHEWALDSIEARPTGRLLCYDPKTSKTTTLLEKLRYANGVCMAHDGQSLFLAESWACSVHRYWFDGPKAGTLECVIKDMPGYPDNINRASDGTYWMAWLGMRTPSFDLALRHPGMRKRMTRSLPQDEWLFPNINTGGVVKFDETGKIIGTFGDLTGVSHPMVTSMREHKGYLYIGGILNNRVGRYRIPNADSNWTAPVAYWGSAAVIFDPILDMFRGKAVTIPPMDGALKPNTALDDAPAALEIDAPDNLCSDGDRLVFSSGDRLLALDPRSGAVEEIHRFDAPVTALAVSPAGDVAIGLDNGELGLMPRNGAPRELPATANLACPTALAFDSSGALYVAQGSARHRPSDWAVDLMSKNAFGSIWRIDLAGSGAAALVVQGLAFPNGLLPLADGKTVIVSESWRHRLVALSDAGTAPKPVMEKLPGYPARLSPAADGGAWLALFAPRNRLIEFTLMEDAYRTQMVRDVPREYWIAPALASGATFLEPLQCGGVKTMGVHKPWSPSRSYGLVVKLDASLRPVASYHSRANGRRHGVTSVAEIGGKVLAASKGGHAILDITDPQGRDASEPRA